MNIQIRHTLDQITQKSDRHSIVPNGTLSIRFDEERVVYLSGDLIKTFDALFCESLKVILQMQATGQVCSVEDTYALSLALDSNGMLEVQVIETFNKQSEQTPLHQVIIDPTSWLLQIAQEFREFQKIPDVSRATVLREKQGNTIPLLEVFI